MRYMKMPHLYGDVSALALGTADIGTKVDEASSYQLMDHFVEHGGNFLDTARIYSDWVPGEIGRSERILGDWLKSRGLRHRIVLATKGAHPRLADFKHRSAPSDIREDVELSLRALKVDAVDIWYLHRDDPSRAVEDFLITLEQLKKEGKILHYACSNWKTERIQQAQVASSREGWEGFIINQPFWNIGSPSCKPLGDSTLAFYDAGMDAFHRETQMPVAPFSSQANGFFSIMAQGHQKGPFTGGLSNYDTPANRKVLQGLMALSEQTGYPISTLVLQYLWLHPFPVAPIVGCTRLTTLNEALEAADKPLLTGETAQALLTLAPEKK
jgi:aryl-alcohol dehydrogenase-like predicted oxidoreductase